MGDAHDHMNWLFVDMDGFFASVEQHLRPELRGRPVGVVPLITEYTCVIAANTAAKRHGVRVGTNVPEAKKLCPNITLVRARPHVYVEVHHAVAESIDKCLPIHKAYSIDEWALRLRGPDREFDTAVDLGRSIKKQIAADFSRWLGCSVGIAPTRLLAKIGSDLDKPDGFAVVSVRDLPGRLAHLEPEDLTGIGRAMGERLRARGVETVEDLWMLTRDQAAEAWGSVVGADWWAGFHGVDEPEIRTHRGSMSHANVLEPRLRTDEGARQMLVRLVSRLGIRMRHEGLLAACLSIKVEYTGAPVFATKIELPGAHDTPTLFRAFYTLWDRRPPTPKAPYWIGATVSGLAPSSCAPGWLFDGVHRDTRLSETMDRINRRWGVSAAYFGAMHDCRHEMDEKIAFGRIPAALVNAHQQPAPCTAASSVGQVSDLSSAGVRR